jgi:peptide/nickel transport system permease protein
VFIAAAPVRQRSRGLWWDAWGRLLHSGPGLAGVLLIALFALVALLAPLLAPSDPKAADLAAAMRPPSWAHPMGTDALGRDYL